MLSHYFDVRVRVEQHVAQWLVLEPDDRSHLGFSLSRPERCDAVTPQLGVSATIGAKGRDRQYNFRVALGPLTSPAITTSCPAAGPGSG